MDSTAIVVPAGLSAKVQEFLASKKTGQIIFNVNQGRIEGYDLREVGKVHYHDAVKP